jgi:uncharacterized membrane protein YraQ (UPF0718 family)
VTSVPLDVGHTLQQCFFMFWETFWPLVLGFAASGAVQAFVSRESMRRSLGNHGPAAVARASLFGMASSSCSYAASAMSKSLFAKGADFVAANVFMFASTNLVIELGVVLIVLMGWQFAVGEYLGGVIMIALLAGAGGVVLRGRAVTSARERLSGTAADEHPCCETDASPPPSPSPSQPTSWRSRIRSTHAWADASTSAVNDMRMLRKELLIGYLAAGALAAVVPAHVWDALFIPGHGGWTVVENALVGPFIALISCVCSVGSVPLAAALWHGGISFGGVVSFLFADLIALPLLLVYRHYYGTRLMLRMLALFWMVMSVAGLVTGQLFGLAGLVPSTRPAHIASTHISWNATAGLNIFFALVLLVVWRLSKRSHPDTEDVPALSGAVTVPPHIPARAPQCQP